jgi:MFS family permease
MNLTWKQWLHGLFAAVIGSFGGLGSTGVAGYFMDYDLTDWNFWKPCFVGAFVTGWAAVKLYIMQFPPPGTLKVTTVTQTDSVRKVDGVTETKRVTETAVAENPEPPPSGPAPAP